MFAVTTRNKLRSPRHAISMIWAWGLIRKQLSRTPGMLAYTTGIASPTEFFTLTLWDKEIDMTLFMASEDHRDMMWNTRRWTESFWSIRWNPTADEVGAWDGRAFADLGNGQHTPPKYVGPGYLNESEVPQSLLPYLRAITRQTEPNTLPLTAVIGRLPARTVLASRRVSKLVAQWRSRPDVLHVKVCAGLGDCLLLVVWKEIAEHEAAALLALLRSNFPDAWAMRFCATDFEIGHWNKVRFRELTGAASSQIA